MRWMHMRTSLARTLAMLVVMLSGFVATPAERAGADTPTPAVVVVYPLHTGGTIGDSGDAGGRFATLIASRIAVGGGLIVKPFAPGTDRAHYLLAATGEGADYYVTGFMTAIGDEVSVVSQIVSTVSGTVIWSQTSLVKTYGDANAQADLIRAAILEREGRYIAQIDAPTAPPDQSQQPATRAHEGGISFLRHHARDRSAPSPVASASPAGAAVVLTTPAPTQSGSQTASPDTAARSAGVTTAFQNFHSDGERGLAALERQFMPHGRSLISLEGTTDPQLRATAIKALLLSLHAHPVSSRKWRVGSSPLNVVRARALSICKAHMGIGALYIANLQTLPKHGTSQASATIDLFESDCRGDLVAHARVLRRGMGEDAQASAIRRSAHAAVAHLRRVAS